MRPVVGVRRFSISRWWFNPETCILTAAGQFGQGNKPGLYDRGEWTVASCLHRYGSVPHAGFGLGLERTVGWICGLHHVRETIPFARTIDRLKP